jgi:prevent-host-death family protein
MDSVSARVSTRELRANISEVIGRTMYGHQRIGITRNGKLSAVVISVEDFELLEELEMAREVEAYRAAKEADDGKRVSLNELRNELEG